MWEICRWVPGRGIDDGEGDEGFTRCMTGWGRRPALHCSVSFSPEANLSFSGRLLLGLEPREGPLSPVCVSSIGPTTGCRSYLVG